MRTKGKLFAVSAMTGTLAVTCVGVGVAASSAAKTHTVKLKSTTVSEKFLRGAHFVEADKDTSKGKYIGTDAASGKFDKKTEKVKADVAFALARGMIYATITINDKTGLLTGRVTGGAGEFKGISGAVSGHSVSEKSTDLTITYRH
jgi:hypothetical protein